MDWAEDREAPDGSPTPSSATAFSAQSLPFGADRHRQTDRQPAGNILFKPFKKKGLLTTIDVVLGAKG